MLNGFCSFALLLYGIKMHAAQEYCWYMIHGDLRASLEEEYRLIAKA